MNPFREPQVTARFPALRGSTFALMAKAPRRSLTFQPADPRLPLSGFALDACYTSAVQWVKSSAAAP